MSGSGAIVERPAFRLARVHVSGRESTHRARNTVQPDGHPPGSRLATMSRAWRCCCS
jgi:hypothetical protein